MNVLMVGVGKNRIGGMLTVANEYLNDEHYNSIVNVKYIATSINGNIIAKILYMLYGYIKIFFALLFSDIDIVHIHMAEKGSTFRKGFVAKLSKIFNKKVLIHLHAGPFMAFYDSLNPTKQNKVKKILNEYCDFVLVLGDFWKKELSKIVKKDYIKVLYNGVPIPSKNYYNIENKNILYLGIMNKEKGIYDLLKAIKLIDDKLNDKIRIRLCGKDLVGDVLENINKLNLQNRIEYIGWIEGEDKHLEMLNSAICVLPSYYEALSMTVIEAMSYGIPVVTTNISTMKELVDSDTYLFNPGDIKTLSEMILNLSENIEARKNVSNILYTRANKIFSQNNFIQNTIKIYNELMK